MTDHRSRRAKLRRRFVSIPALFAAAFSLTITIPIWLPVAIVVDAARLRFRFPIARLMTFAVCWSWIEIGGVVRALGVWVAGRSDDPATQYALMRWWANLVMSALQATTGIAPRAEGIEALAAGNAIVLCRHASLADSLLSAWAIRGQADVWPRYVLKDELLLDPCLDIVGLRVPNHFLDRDASDTETELKALSRLASGLGPGSVAVIFAEGTRANDRKRQRAIDKIGERDPERAERLAGLRRLIPPRPAGSKALIAGAPGADVVFAWHTGFDGLDTFGGILAKLAKPLPPVRFVARRVARSEVPDGAEFTTWLDDQWLQMDAQVDEALRSYS